MKTRIITAIVGIGLFVAAVAASIKWSSMILFVLLTAVGVVGVYEALHNTGYVKSRFLLFCCIIYSAVAPFAYSGYIPVNHAGFIVVLGSVMFSYAMFNHKKITPHDVTYAFSMTVIITFCVWAMAAVFESADGHGLFYLILVFVASWGCDTGAYFTGYFFGKHKMAPEISPKKTVEGAVGGIVAAILGMLIACLIFNRIKDDTANTVLLVAITPVLAFAGMMGDLIASYIKRACGIKDYGKIMPGHGGILDRFDSVVTVIPLMYIVVTHCQVLL